MLRQSILTLAQGFIAMEHGTHNSLLLVAKENERLAHKDDNLWKWILFAGVPAVAGIYLMLKNSWDDVTKAFDGVMDVLKKPLEVFGQGADFFRDMFSKMNDMLDGKADNTGVPQPIVKAGTISPSEKAETEKHLADINAGRLKTPRPAARDPQAKAVDMVDAKGKSNIQLMKQISKAYGIDPYLLPAIAHVESTLNSAAVNSISGARGLFQFLPRTWNDLVTNTYKDLNYTNEDIDNVPRHITVAARWFSGIQRRLKGMLGRNPSPSEVYMVHFLGGTGGTRFIETLNTTPNALAAPQFSKAAEQNPAIFYADPGTNKQPLTFKQVFGKVFGKVGKAYNKIAEAEGATQLAANQAMPEPTAVASASPITPTLAAPQQQQAQPSLGKPLMASAASSMQPTPFTLPDVKVDQPIQQQVAVTDTAKPPSDIPASTPSVSKEYIRDRRGRVVSINVG